MGRELRRVPLDFDHPVDTVWPGFLNNHYKKSRPCRMCIGIHGDSTGLSPMGRQLHDAWYGYNDFKPEQRGSKLFTPTTPIIWARASWNIEQNPEYYLKGNRMWIWVRHNERLVSGSEAISFRYRQEIIYNEALRLCDHYNTSWSHHLNQMDVDALIDHGRLHDFTHTITPGKGWEERNPPYHPTAEEVNNWSLSGFGHDSINQWVVLEAFCDRLGYDYTCDHCKGGTHIWGSEEDRLACENWERINPPEGEGYQIWETVTEGSPISPVFATPHELATHMATTRWGADDGTSYEEWMVFIEGPGWAPSFMGTLGNMKEGVKAMVKLEAAKRIQT